MTDAPFAIGSDLWPGLSKLTEEAGEVCQVVGKILATGGDSEHWDGTDLSERLTDELADLIAAIAFVMCNNPQLDRERYVERCAEKLHIFNEWHKTQSPTIFGTESQEEKT